MGLIEKFVKEIEEEVFQPEPPVRFSINLDYMDNFRLQYLAKRLGYNRASLSAEFIKLAIREAENTLGLQPFDFSSEYSKEIMKACSGGFYQDETGYYRLLSNGDKIKLYDTNDENEIDYSLANVDKEDSNND